MIVISVIATPRLTATIIDILIQIMLLVIVVTKLIEKLQK